MGFAMNLTSKKLTAGQALACIYLFLAGSGCVTATGGTVGAPVVGTPSEPAPKVRAQARSSIDSHADAEYYLSHALTLAKEEPGEINRTDFARFRRGRLYAGGPADSDVMRALGKKLTAVFDQDDQRAIVDITARILIDDEADIRAHMLRSIALRKLQRTREADFHRDVALGLIQSIIATGDGRNLESAWTVFRVKEEYEIIKVLGCLVESQALKSNGDRKFDVLVARKAQGGGVIRVHFDITELFAEEGRDLRTRSADRAVQQGVAPDGRSFAAPARR
jgi:hypothetical protein